LYNIIPSDHLSQKASVRDSIFNGKSECLIFAM